MEWGGHDEHLADCDSARSLLRSLTCWKAQAAPLKVTDVGYEAGSEPDVGARGLHLHISMRPEHNEEMNEHEARSRESP